MSTVRKIHLKIRKIRIPTPMDVFILLIVFLIIIPDGLVNISNTVYNLCYVYGYYLVLAIIIIFLLIKKKRKYSFFFPKCLFSSFLFLIGTVLITILHGSGFGNWINFFSILLITFLLTISQKERLDRLMITFLFVLEFWIYVNFLLMIIYPSGMYYLESNNVYQNWILGYKSSLYYYVLPALCFGWVNKEYRGQNIRFYFLLAVSTIETVIVENTMLIVGILLFFVFTFFKIINIKKICNVKNYFIGILLANTIFLFSLTWFVSTDIGEFFFYITGKNATISRRASIIWPITFKYIKEHPIIGSGMLSSTERVEIYNGVKAAIHSHNQILEIIFIGGFFLLVLYILMHITIGKKLTENQNLATSKVLSLTVFILYIMMVVEVFTRRIAAGIWLVLFLSCMCGELHKQLIKRKDCQYFAQESNKYQRKKFSIKFGRNIK